MSYSLFTFAMTPVSNVGVILVESTFLAHAPLPRRHRLSVAPFSEPALPLRIEAALDPRLK